MKKRKPHPEDSISLVWHVDDVLALDNNLSIEEARKVLRTIKHYHDANIGVGKLLNTISTILKQTV